MKLPALNSIVLVMSRLPSKPIVNPNVPDQSGVDLPRYVLSAPTPQLLEASRPFGLPNALFPSTSGLNALGSRGVAKYASASACVGSRQLPSAFRATRLSGIGTSASFG